MPTENQFDCPAFHKRSASYPYGDRVPRTVRMVVTATADRIPGVKLSHYPEAKAGQTYRAWTNSHGAVTAVMEDGTRLGLRPAEFEVDSWHNLGTEPHPDPIAWMVGTAIWWTKEEAERDAAETGLPIVGLGPMTDAAEQYEKLWSDFVRIDDENDRLRLGIKGDYDLDAWLAFAKERDTLRAQLAELWRATNLLMKVTPRNKGSWADKFEAKAIIERLSAGAEPSALNDCAICRDLGNQCMECEEGEFRQWADRHFAAADYRKTDAGVFIQDWMRHAYGAWCARGAITSKQ